MKCAEANLVVLFNDMQVLSETTEQEDTCKMSSPSTFNEWILAMEETISKFPEWDFKNFQLLKEQFWAVSKLQKNPCDNYLQLCKSAIECIGTKLSDEYIGISIEWFLTCGLLSFNNSTLPDSSQIFNFIESYLDSDLTQTQRNICIVLSLVANQFQEHKKLFDLTEKLQTFFHKIIVDSKSHLNVLYAVVCLESLSQTFDFKNQITDDQYIIYELEKLAIQHSESVNHPDFNSVVHQIKFVSQHLLDKLQRNQQQTTFFEHKIINVFKTHNQMPFIKLSRDNLEIRSDWSMQSYQTQEFEMTKGIYFYEVTLLTSGPAKIGWASKKSSKMSSSDYSSVGYDGYRNWIWHANKCYSIQNQPKLPNWKTGDVVGLLVDLSTPQKTESTFFTFYLNGVQIKHQFIINSLETPFSPTVSLSVAQQCILNFGNVPFQFPPENIEYQSFIQARNKEISLFTEKMLKLYTEKFSGINVDSEQQEFDLLLIELEFKVKDDFASNSFDWQYFYQDLNRKLQTLFSNNNNAWKLLMESIIRVLDVKIGKNTQQIDAIIYWLGASINTLSKSFTIPMFDLEETIMSHINNNATNSKNLQLVLLLFFNNFDEASKDILQFLCNVFLNENCHYSTRLYSLICLQHFDSKKEKYLKSAELGKVLSNLANEYFEKFTVSEFYSESLDCSKLQLGFYSKCIVSKISEKLENNENVSVSLDQDKLNESCGHLFARNDMPDWKEILFNQYSFNSGIYFYEVILLTSSMMEIGWATKHSEGENFKLTLSFDGHHRILWHFNDGTPNLNLNRWKAGDVLGCLIKLDEGSLTTVFYLNGRPVFKRFVDSTFHSYCPALSIGCHQQVYVNIGQAPFQRPPSSFEFSDVHSLYGGKLCQLSQFCVGCVAKIVSCSTCNRIFEKNFC